MAEEEAERASKNLSNTARKRVYGLTLMSLAGFYVVLANTLVQLIHEHSETEISSLTILFSRSAVTVFMALVFMAIARTNPFPSKSEVLGLTALGLTGVGAILFMYLALTLIPVGDVTVINFTAPIFTSILGLLCLKQPCSFIDVFLGFLSFCGVFVMTRPTIIFGKQDEASATLCESLTGCENNEAITNKRTDHNYMYGVGYTLIAAFLVSAFYVLNKLAVRNGDVILSLFYTGLMGLILPSIVMSFTKKLYNFGKQWDIWMLLFLIGILSVVHLLFVAESLQFEDAGPAALIRNVDSVYAFSLQYLILGVAPTWLTILGAFIVVLSSTIMGVTRYFAAREYVDNTENDS